MSQPSPRNVVPDPQADTAGSQRSNSSSSAQPRFRNRYRICGQLTLTSDLYVGDGDVRPARPADTAKERGPDARPTAEIATVARGWNAAGQEVPVIPGAALKGVLRAYLEDCLVPQGQIERLFGRPPRPKKAGDPDARAEDDLGLGGRVDFGYAFLHAAPDATAVAGWNAETQTGTSAFVGIDRVTRGPADRVLYAADYVPRGAVFTVDLTAYDLQDADLGLLLGALRGFDDQRHPIRLGANHADACGRATWELTEIRRVGRDQLRTWLERDTVRPGWEDFAPAERDAVVQRALAAASKTPLQPPPRLTVEVRLDFQGPFLVNDPSRCTTKPSAEASPAQGPKMASDHVARLTLTAEGLKVLLPASSLRGALRSQAERILRTLRPEATGDPWGSVDREGLIERLFGHAGQRARLECADFLSTKPVGPPDSDPEKFVPRHPQEFVAIDRFTGGVAGAKKFDAEAVYRPSLVGTLSLPLDAVAPAALGLLALVLRDLSEGDITLGAKAAIGYGACRATITQIALTGRPPAGPWADLWPKTQDIDWSFVARQPLVVPEPVKLLVRGLVAEFRVQQGVSS